MPYIINSQWIKQLRSDLGMNTSSFANILGVSQQLVYHWESDRSSPTDYQLAAMIQLRRKLDNQLVDQYRNKTEIANVILSIIATGGLVAFLAWLFNDKK